MSEANPREETVRSAFAAINAGDYEEIAQWATEDCAAHTRMSSVTGKPYVGHDGIREWVLEVKNQFKEFDIRLQEVAELVPGRVFAAGRANVRGRESDLPWHEDVYYSIAFEGQKIKELRMFLDRAAAEQAVRAGE
jgi:ketosteroid isomerase-like protein